MGKNTLTEPRIYEDIRSQADSLQAVFQRQCGEGLPAMLEAVSLLSSGRRVLITGIGASMFASLPFEYALWARGIEATLIEAAELLHYGHNAFRDAVWVVVSRSGESIEIKRLLEEAGTAQTVIGITNEPESLVARRANVSIHIGSLPDEMVAIQTYTGTLLTLHILLRLMDVPPSAVSLEFQKILPVFAQQVKTGLADQRTWDDFLKLARPMALLARGPSMASALEGALLFNEIAKFPAFASPIASFRHGPIEVADADFRAVVFASGQRTRQFNVALGEELARFGAAVQMVGLRDANSAELAWQQTPDVPETLAPLFDIVPLQAAATRMAELRGIWPGSFRYTPQVAVDEFRFHAPPGGSKWPNGAVQNTTDHSASQDLVARPQVAAKE